MEDTISEEKTQINSRNNDDIDQYSDSEDSDGSIDPAVRDDMEKFQKTFDGMKEHFRLINRIGEGINFFSSNISILLMNIRNLFNCI